MDAPAGGNWLYAFPGKPLMQPASGVTCRSLVKHGWFERTRVDDNVHVALYAISAKGRRELEESGLRQAPQPREAAAPANIKF